MSRPSIDTATERHVAEFRRKQKLPKALTLRFLALLTKKELATLARIYEDLTNSKTLSGVINSRAAARFYRARLERIQSERRQRGHIKDLKK